MTRTLTLALAAVALAGFGSAAIAQDAALQAPNRAQVAERSAAAFARLDANHDGKLDPADRGARRDARQDRRFNRLDANDDGQLNPADREARRQQMFDRIDTDRSGGISREEFAARADRRLELRGEGPGREGPRLARRNMRRGEGPRFDRGGPDGPRLGRGAPGLMRAADSDSDGAISQAEFSAAALARFDRIDADKDGTIGADERPQRRLDRGLSRGR